MKDKSIFAHSENALEAVMGPVFNTIILRDSH